MEDLIAHEKRPPSNASLSPPPVPHHMAQAAQYSSSSSSEDEDLVDETSSTAWVGAGAGGFDESMELQDRGSSEDEGYTVRVSGQKLGLRRGLGKG